MNVLKHQNLQVIALKLLSSFVCLKYFYFVLQSTFDLDDVLSRSGSRKLWWGDAVLNWVKSYGNAKALSPRKVCKEAFEKCFVPGAYSEFL